MINQECCVCYSTTGDIEPELRNSFMVIPCGGNHTMCFSCFMRNANTKCPMCRFNYKTMRPDGAEPDYLPVAFPVEDYQQFEPNQDIAFIDNWWIQLKHLIPEMLPVIQREVFEKQLNITNAHDEITIDFLWMSDTIAQNQYYADNIIDISDEYDMCCRMYLTKMIVAFAEIEGEDCTDFVSSVNDFIQHEYDNM